jgi:hypothetical protein
MTLNILWTVASFILTIFILSYVFGDNMLFRIGSYLFVGVAAGYATLMVIYQVILPRLILPLVEGSNAEKVLTLPPLVLGILLLAKLSPRFSWLGKLSMGYLVGAGSAVAIGGAVLGTLFTQVGAAIGIFEMRTDSGGLFVLVEGVVLLIGTIGTLAYFHFGAHLRQHQTPQRPAIVVGLAVVGEIFIAIALGALFAGVYIAALTALIERLDFLISTIFSLF